ncbi:hypothetical protein H6G97_20910 [Nostoc flagelliforme FACHB-838]|uniref:Uncharacterized protein n=2 Tax=Nostoc flagelliforme TaxID=1306274 RepID=A0ABR8DSN6_9NOSO|nr:hypothetical protein [Nostoc flagelliforme FACHB-838]
MVVSTFNQDWQDLVNGNSEIYKAVVAVSLLVAVILISFWSVGWYSEIANNGFSTDMINEIIYPLIVALMLGMNNGALLADTSLLFRSISISLNDRVLDITRNGITFREAIRNTNMDQAFILAAKAQIAECQKKPVKGVDDQGNETQPRKECIDKKTQEAKQAADKYRRDNGLPTSQNSWNPLDIAGETINSVVQGLSYIIFSGLQAAFQYVVQISFLLNAYIAPIFLVLSLLPVGAKPIYAWLSGWLALTLVLISYSIIVGIAASSIVNAPSTNPLFLQLVQAILSPLLAVAIGTGGGMALFSSFSSSAKLMFRR